MKNVLKQQNLGTCGAIWKGLIHECLESQRKRHIKWFRKKIFEQIISNTFPNLLTGINVLIQETKWIPTKINMKKTTPGTFVSNGWKPRYKVDHVRKRRTSHTGKNCSNDYWIFIKNYEIQNSEAPSLKYWKKTNNTSIQSPKLNKNILQNWKQNKRHCQIMKSNRTWNQKC